MKDNRPRRLMRHDHILYYSVELCLSEIVAGIHGCAIDCKIGV